MDNPNVALAYRWFEEVWNQKRAEAIDELTAEDGVCLTEAGTVSSRQEFREKMFTGFVSAFPDLHITIEGTVAQDDQVVVRWTAVGTHTGEGLGFPPSNRKINIRGMTWIRFRDGKMVEGWDCWNLHGMLQSLQPQPV